MLKGMSEKETKKEIIELTAEYADQFHKTKKNFKEGDRITYAARFYDKEELVNLVDSSLEFWLTSGRYTDAFEKELADFLGLRFAFFVNSGSSANLLAFMALTSPLLKDRAVRRGDEVITAAAGFPTTVAPLIQFGAVPVFVDMEMPGYNIDTALLEAARTSATKAVMVAHTLGNPFDLSTVKKFCDKYNLWLLEDNCDALGSRYELDGKWRFTGTIGHIGTSSFYPPHHMTTGEGGAVYTDDPLLAKILLSMRDWGRDCVCPSGKDNMCGHRFDRQYGELPLGYDHKYVYSHFGYNLKATDMQAAIGLAQIKKLPGFIQVRRRNWNMLWERFHEPERGLAEFLEFQEPLKNTEPSWFGFMITVKNGIKREDVVKYLEENQIQTRMLFAGNLIKHPCFDELRKTGEGYRTVSKEGASDEQGMKPRSADACGEQGEQLGRHPALPVTDRIMYDTFWIGVYPGMTEDMIDFMADKLTEIVNQLKRETRL